MKFKKNRLGFTLIELVVTTSIMGTLAAVAIPSFIETNAKAKADKSVANLADIGSAIGQKFNELASQYGRIEVFPNNTAEENLTTALTAIQAWSGTDTYEAADAGRKTSISVGQVIPSLPASPFGDKPYAIERIQQSIITYEITDDNVTVTVQNAKVRYRDIEDIEFYIDFEY